MWSNGPESEAITPEERRARELYDAVKDSDEHRVRDLFAAGYDVNAVVELNKTSLGAAIKKQNDAIAMLLIDAGAHLRESEWHSLLLLTLKSAALCRTGVALLKVATKELKEELPRFRDPIGSTALHLAAEGNNVEAAQLLLEIGVPIDRLNKRDETALFIGVDFGHRNVTKILLEHGAKWDITKRDGRNVLDVALGNNDVQMAELFLSHLYSAEKTTGIGDPALDTAIRKMDLKEALRLLNDGRSLAQREGKRIQLDRQGSIDPVVGLDNEYLKSLCSLVSDLEVSVNSNKPAEKDQACVCAVCATLVVRFSDGTTEKEKKHSPEPLEYDLDYLRKSSTQAKCPLCDLILESVSDKRDQYLLFPLWISLEGHSICVQSKSRSKFAMIFLGHNVRVKNDQHTGSDEGFLQASSWLLTCLTQHPNCINAEGPLSILPSRVIDVGPADGSQDPFLIVSQGRRGRYIALSHRWGTSDITKTTKANLEKRIECIKFNSLTKTMQDAVTVTRKLGVRYLWIDALCIIQDSHSDWSVEACDMANIYRNSLLTIAAAAAFDHFEGCFRPRSILSRELRLPESSLGTTEPLCVIAQYDRFNGKLESPLDSRGWILQEQLLSPRVLKYSWNQLHWECISSTESEYRSSVTMAPADIMRFKRALGGFRSTSMALKEQAHASWQQIVHSYTRRTLTKDSDKLMAITGIAKFTGDIMSDRFLAGLWGRELWRDLLWSSDVSLKYLPPERLQSIQLPSWSWASVSCPVAYKWPVGSSPAYVKGTLKVLAVDVDSEISNGDVHGSLIVEGEMRKFFWRVEDQARLFYRQESPESITLAHTSKEKNTQPTTPEHTPEYAKDDAPDRKDRVSFLKRLTRRLKHSSARKKTNNRRSSLHNPKHSAPVDPENWFQEDPKHSAQVDPSEAWRPDVSPQGLKEVWLLAVASESYWIHCLALIQTDKEDEYKRVGLCHVDAYRLLRGVLAAPASLDVATSKDSPNRDQAQSRPEWSARNITLL